MSSKPRKLKAQQSHVFNAVEQKPILLDLLEIATSSDRKTIFIEALLEFEPTAFVHSDNKKPEDLFKVFTAWFGNYDNSKALFPGIKDALQYRQQYFLERRFIRRQFITKIGLDWTPDDKSNYFSKVNFVCEYFASGESSFLS